MHSPHEHLQVTTSKGRGTAASLRGLLLFCIVLAACSAPAPAVTVALAIPVCGDADSAVVVEDSPDADRHVAAYNGKGERLWRASLGSDAYPVAVGRCDVAVLSSSVEEWPHATVGDPLACVYSREGIAVWPGQTGFLKYRVLAATAVGTGVVATGNGGIVSLRTQVNGEYVHTEPMASADVDWVSSADGAVGVAYEYANPDGHLYFYQQDRDRWRFVRRIAVPAPLVQVYAVAPDRYLVRTENDFILYANGRSIQVSDTDFYSDAYLTDAYVVLISRRLEGEGVVRNDLKVLDDGLHTVFSRAYAANVLVSSTHDLVLSTPGRVTVVSQAGIRDITVDPDRYARAGPQGSLVLAGAGGVSFSRLTPS
jgi:hypothetical protein